MENLLEIFKSLFKGRQDVFATRWENSVKSGYVPAYDLNWDEFKKHQEKGGTLKDFPNKRFSPLTDARLSNHLLGKEVIGIYPLLQNNTSWFIAADFDEATSQNRHWITDCRRFIDECEKHNLPVYLERSRSGAGGHVWLFFENEYPAIRSRKIFAHLLAACGIVKDKNSSFDRLFPNQDYHSGKEMGNLIALPLQKEARQNQNTCFINPITEVVFADQLLFLNNIRKVSKPELDALYNLLIDKPQTSVAYNSFTNSNTGGLPIILDNHIILARKGLPNLMFKYLRDNLNFLNTEYFVKKNSGRNTFGTEYSFKCLDEQGDDLVIPRGFIGNLMRYCKEHKIEYLFEDKRIKLENIQYAFSASLYLYQQGAVEATNKKDFGVIVSPPGSGKTIMGLAIIARKQQPALIIVHRKQLFDQWVERTQSFLGIPAFKIGKIQGGTFDIGDEITVAMIQSLQSDKLPIKLYRSFGTILVDECHHTPAKTFREIIGNFHSFYLYGFTATPIRKNKDEKLIFINIGDIIHEVIIPANQQGNKSLSVVVQNTELFVPFDAATDKAETLLHVLIHDTARNELIINDVKREIKAGRKVIVLTERKAHIEILYQYLKGTCEVVTLTGEDSPEKRKAKFYQIKNEEFQVLLATGQFIGEGTDIGILNCLILAYPFSFEGKLIQYIGRVQRSPVTPIIYDYKDYRIEYLSNLFKQRNKYYRKLLKTGQLSKFDELILVFRGTDFYINETEKLLDINCLELPLPVERFNEDIVWRIRIIHYNEEDGDLFSEILDYNFPLSQSKDTLQGDFYFYGIEKIRFRNIETAGFLKSIILAQQPMNEQRLSAKNTIPTLSLPEQIFLKTMKVPFWKVSFLAGAVSFPIYIEAIDNELTFEISNNDIRREFEAIREYFSKALKKKIITVDVTIRYNTEKIISATAKSTDINAINSAMIDTVRFQFVKKEILKPAVTTDKQMHTLDNLLAPYKEAKKIYPTEQALIDDLLSVKNSKHYFQLKYLASKHEASILKLRFVLQPFSFLFLLAGEINYYIIWETLDTEEATYIWHTIKTKEAIRKLIDQIEKDLYEIQQNGRQSFIETNHDNFSRVIHDYADPNKGFITWKGMLEERIS